MNPLTEERHKGEGYYRAPSFTVCDNQLMEPGGRGGAGGWRILGRVCVVSFVYTTGYQRVSLRKPSSSSTEKYNGDICPLLIVSLLFTCV